MTACPVCRVLVVVLLVIDHTINQSFINHGQIKNVIWVFDLGHQQILLLGLIGFFLRFVGCWVILSISHQ